MDAGFKTVSWAHSTNIYEVNVRQYSAEGTFNAFARHLNRLKDMGVQTLWFMPIHPIGEIKRWQTLGSYYSIKDYNAINPEFGTSGDFKNLVQQAHALNFKVIIDWVANHTAWDHVWTKDHPEFYERDGAGNFKSPYDWYDVIQLDHHSTAQQDVMIDAMKFWVNEYDIDGFRCDMAHLVPLSFWNRARHELDELKPLFWLAETEDANYHQVFDASYTWEFLHTMEAYWRKETDIGGLDNVLHQYNTVFPSSAIRMFFTSNHDENSHSGSEYERMGDAAKTFAVLCATWNGSPLVYSGQELPVTKRLNFYNKDEIPWTPGCALHDFYRTLLNLHSSHPALRAGDTAVETFRIKTTDDKNVFAYLRKNADREVLVLLNLSPEHDLHFEITDEKVTGIFKNVFLGTLHDFTNEKHVTMQGWEYQLYEK
jgi:alpha-amylase